MSEAVTLQTYTLELIGPSDDPLGFLVPFPPRDWVEAIEETTENLTDLLPDGYSVRIREWDAEEETPHE